MYSKPIHDRVWAVGVADAARRLFDALIPLPYGTSYNSYVVQGDAKTVLLDTADPSVRETYLSGLAPWPRLDYVVAHHAEQDHSGLLPDVLARHPEAVLLCSPKARAMLCDLLPLPAERIRTVEDGEPLDLGGRTLRFVHVPWVHWPETLATFLEPERILFPCDMFGAHLPTPELFAREDARSLPAARGYFAQILMPYAHVVRKDLEKVCALHPAMIAPSHGPVHDDPAPILAAYREWLHGAPLNKVALPCVSMHGSTQAMADRLAAELRRRGVAVETFDLAALPLDRFASALVDAATLVFAAPAVWNAPHPAALFAALVAGGLKPKAPWGALIGSYGWGAKALENPAELLPGLKVEFLPSVHARGRPGPEALAALDALAETIAAKHGTAGLRA